MDVIARSPTAPPRASGRSAEATERNRKAAQDYETCARVA